MLNDQTMNAIYAFIAHYQQERGHAPNLREIGAGVGLSHTLIRTYLLLLREAGRIDYQPGRARAIAIRSNQP